MDKIAPNEQFPARWEAVDERHVDKIREAFGFVFSPANPGFVLMHHDEPRGYVELSISQEQGRVILSVDDITIAEKFRGPLAILSLFKILDPYATKEKITHVRWVPVTPVMQRFTELLTGNPDGEALFEVEKLRQALRDIKV